MLAEDHAHGKQESEGLSCGRRIPVSRAWLFVVGSNTVGTLSPRIGGRTGARASDPDDQL
jgi:hypothetical protein